MVTWIDDASIEATAYSKYWNDEEIESTKELYILGRSFREMEEYVASTGLIEDFKLCIARLRRSGHAPGGVGIDVAAGMLWLLPVVFDALTIERMICLEYSKHRLLKMGPKVIEHYNLPADKITLALGSFYDIRLPAESVDFAILCQAFHHADDPEALLRQIRKVLRPDGTVIVLGEQAMNWGVARDLMHMARYLAARLLPRALQRGPFHPSHGRPASFIARSQDIFPPDPALGDHAYLPRDYRKIFRRCGFSIELLQRERTGLLSLVGRKLAHHRQAAMHP
jgi:ubiquinone/menaquinone biosynthesis C-methylase UbiE